MNDLTGLADAVAYLPSDGIPVVIALSQGITVGDAACALSYFGFPGVGLFVGMPTLRSPWNFVGS